MSIPLLWGCLWRQPGSQGQGGSTSGVRQFGIPASPSPGEAAEGLAYIGGSALGNWDGGWRERGPDWLAQQRSQILRLTPELT